MLQTKIQHIARIITCLLLLVVVAVQRDAQLWGVELSGTLKGNVPTATEQSVSDVTQKDGRMVVNTLCIGKDVKGFRGNTPVKIYIRKNVVTKVEALPNKETPSFFKRAANILLHYEGKKVADVSTLSVDAVSGATLSSKAIKTNVEKGLEYYKKHK